MNQASQALPFDSVRTVSYKDRRKPLVSPHIGLASEERLGRSEDRIAPYHSLPLAKDADGP